MVATERNIANKIARGGFHSGAPNPIPDSGGLYRVAIRGCLIGTIFVSVLALSQNALGQQGVNPEAPQQQQRAEDTPPEEKTFGSDNLEAECNKRQKTAEADLCQQWRMANAADKQVQIIGKQYDIQFYEVILLIGTLGASLIALFITIRTSRAQLRAYVNLVGAKVDWLSNGQVSVVIAIKNSGQTPAHGVRHANQVTIGKPDNFSAISEPDDEASMIDLGAGVDMTFPTPNPQYVPVSAVLAAQQRTQPLYAWGEIRYRDVFGKNRWTRYRMVLSKDSDHLTPCPGGNESN